METPPLAEAGSIDDLERELAREGVCAVRVLGTSMRPTLRDGDVALVERVEARDLRFGDVVAVRIGAAGEGRLIVHRFLWRCATKGPELLVLKGDGLSSLDRYGSEPGDRLLGRVRAAWRESRALPAISGPGALGWALLSLLAIPLQRARGR